MQGCVGLNGVVTPFKPTDIDAARLVQPPLPPKLIVQSERDIADIAAAAKPERLASWRAARGGKTLIGPQMPFFFESELGRAFLSSGPGRALARGEPAERCPIFGAALDAASPQQAAGAALSSCLAQRSRRETAADCGCRLLTADTVLFAPAEAFAYPRAVHAVLTPLGPDMRPTGAAASLIAEEILDPAARTARPQQSGPREAMRSGMSSGRIAALAAGARRLQLIGLTGLVGTLDLSEDGRAVLSLATRSAAPTTLNGRWRASGFRRGRRALSVALTAKNGARRLLLIGYEPQELLSESERLLRESIGLF